MKKYNIELSDDVSNTIQYFLDNKDKITFPILPDMFNVTTVEEYLQVLINRNIAPIYQFVNTIKEKEIVDTVKSNVDILNQVNAKISGKK